MNQEILSGVGYGGWDSAIGVFSLIVGLLHFWDIGHAPVGTPRLYSFAKFITGVGWVTWGMRLVLDILTGGDPKIALPGLMSITFIVAGTLMINLVSPRGKYDLS